MSFLKKYQKKFEDATGVKIPEQGKTEESKAPDAPTTSTVAHTADPNLTPAVAPGWTTQWDANATPPHWTYTNTATGATQVEHPDPANYGGQSMPPGGPVVEDGKPKKDKNGMLIGAAGGLATGAFGKKLMGKAKKKALKQAGMGGHSKHGGGHGRGGGGGGSGSSSSDSDSD